MSTERIIAVLAKRPEVTEQIRRSVQLGDYKVLEVASREDLLSLAREPRVALACASVDDLGTSSGEVVRALAALNESKAPVFLLEAPELDSRLLGLFTVIVQRERQRRLAVLREGQAKARARGTSLGRKRKRIDTNTARRLLDGGHSINAVSRELGVSPRSLRRRLEAETADSNPMQ